MELKLNIYNGKKVEKTYIAETIDLTFGTVEDVLDVLDIEHIASNTDLLSLVPRAAKQLKPFLKDIFDGLTDEEIRRTRISDIVTIFKELYNYAALEIANNSGTKKN